MIYLFYGSDERRVREKAFAWVAAAREKQPELAYVRLAREELTPSVLEDAAQSGGLFVKRLLILLDDPFPKARVGDENEEGESDTGSIIEEHLDALAKSENVVLILAPRLSTVKAKKISAQSAKAYECNAPPRADARGFNSALVNALGASDSKKLWLEIVRTLRAGDSPEMIHGLLHWKARDLMQKGRSDARALSLKLIMLLQDSRRTGATLEVALEKFALSV